MLVKSDFKPNPLFTNRHLQTIIPNVFFPRAKVELRRERLELPDGDFNDVLWTSGGKGPIVIVLHGLEGSIRSHYAAGIMARIHALGFRGALLYARNCSGEPNRLPISYHSGFTQDLDHLTGLLKRREPGTALAAVGYSLGGNLLLKWLGESPHAERLQTGVAVSVPFDLGICSTAIERGFARVYMWELMGRMRRSAIRKFRTLQAPFQLPDIAALKTFREFDDALTAPLHGYRDAEDYYTRCSSRQFLRHIRVPTLVLHSADDPFMTPAALPRQDELSGAVTLELSERGGHVGFVDGTPWRPGMWLEQRIGRHLTAHLSE
jgi:predicted alpha/beta-fold hydrolase